MDQQAIQFDVVVAFRDLLRPLPARDVAELEADILERGIRDRLVVWRERNILLDGHHRFEIATKHGLDYETIDYSFADDVSARLWVIGNQLRRRNLTDWEVSYYRGKQYEEEKKSHGVRGAGKKTDKSCQSFTRKRLATEHGVSEGTIQNDARLAQAIDRIGAVCGADAKAALLERKTKITKGDVLGLARKTDTGFVTRVMSVLVDGSAVGIADAKRKARKADYKARAEAGELPAGQYRVFYADPPWQYGNRGLDQYGHPDRHYPTMPLDEICAVEIPSEANAVLFMWATAPLLQEGLQVIKAWGFKYKTHFVWDKKRHNFGHYSSVQHEILMLATRGSCTPDIDRKLPSVVQAKRGEHSAKPEVFRELIETLYPHGRRLELFARRPAEGWAVWGNEA